MRTYLTEFPADYAPPAELLELLLAAGWTDESYGNDACPSFERKGWKLWTDNPDSEGRDTPTLERFCLVTMDSNFEHIDDIWQVETVAECIELLKKAELI